MQIKIKFTRIKPHFIQLVKFCLFVIFICIFFLVIYWSTDNPDAVVDREAPGFQSCKTLKWQRPPAKHVTALISAPGGGNTWVRELLQKSTGIVTGSVYSDGVLKQLQFPGEYVSDGSVLVVKTHLASDYSRFQRAVLLIRNPRDTILAEFNRLLSGGHVFEVRTRRFKEEGWVNFFEDSISEWEEIYKVWLTRFEGPLHVLQYEHLLNNTELVLQQLLEFLGQDVSEADIKCAVQSWGMFKRKHTNTFDPFTRKMYKIMNEARNKISNMILTRSYTSSNTHISGKYDWSHPTLMIISNIILRTS